MTQFYTYVKNPVFHLNRLTFVAWVHVCVLYVRTQIDHDLIVRMTSETEHIKKKKTQLRILAANQIHNLEFGYKDHGSTRMT